MPISNDDTAKIAKMAVERAISTLAPKKMRKNARDALCVRSGRRPDSTQSSYERHLVVHCLHDFFGHSYKDIAEYINAKSANVAMKINSRARVLKQTDTVFAAAVAEATRLSLKEYL